MAVWAYETCGARSYWWDEDVETLVLHICPLVPQLHHALAAGHVVAGHFSACAGHLASPKNIAPNFVCTPGPFSADQETTVEHFFAHDLLLEQGGSRVTKNSSLRRHP